MTLGVNDDVVPLVMVVVTIDVAADGTVDDDSSFGGGGGGSGWSIVTQIVFVRTGISIYRSIYTYIHTLVSVYQHRVCRRRTNIPFVMVAVLCFKSAQLPDQGIVRCPCTPYGILIFYILWDSYGSGYVDS